MCARDWRLCAFEGSPWQRSFHDRALRSEEDVRQVANYILMNPVRAGLVDEPSEYLLSGSLEWEL